MNRDQILFMFYTMFISAISFLTGMIAEKTIQIIGAVSIITVMAMFFRYCINWKWRTEVT